MTKRGKPRARANGEGTIYQTEQGTFVAQYTTPTGQRRSKTHSSQRKAKQWLTQQLRDIDTGDYIEPSELSFGSYYKKFVAVYKSTKDVSAASQKTYQDTQKRLEKYARKIWLMPIADIKAIDVKLAIHAMSDAGLSDRTCEMTLIHIRACFEQAVDDKLVRSNVSKKVTPPSSHTATVKRVKVIPDHIYDQFIADLTRPVKMTAKGQPNKQDIEAKTHRDAIFFMLHTGLREGELRALRWDDIDLKNKTAAIRSSIDVNGEISMTKNKETDIIPLDDEVIAMLQTRRFADTGFVFTNRPGRPLNLKNLFDTMRKLMPGYNLHTCRKTFTTRAARAGIDPKVLQSLTRHKSIETLLKHYRAVEMSDKQAALAKISGYCKSTANPDKKSAAAEK